MHYLHKWGGYSMYYCDHMQKSVFMGITNCKHTHICHRVCFGLVNRKFPKIPMAQTTHIDCRTKIEYVPHTHWQIVDEAYTNTHAHTHTKREQESHSFSKQCAIQHQNNIINERYGWCMCSLLATFFLGSAIK